MAKKITSIKLADFGNLMTNIKKKLMQYDFCSWQSLPLSFMHWVT